MANGLSGMALGMALGLDYIGLIEHMDSGSGGLLYTGGVIYTMGVAVGRSSGRSG